MKVKILGAGSIGNHLAHAARSLGWKVHLCDIDGAALARTRDEIYPSRYGRWDDAIDLSLSSDAPRGGFDVICIGTPPDCHVPLAAAALEERPVAVLVEKPLCTPALDGAQALVDRSRALGVRMFVGYDHAVGKASEQFVAWLDALGAVETLDVEFREHWAGIFAAHPWLSGPQDTYLGYWRRGGGSGGEHSHATHLWQHFAHHLNAGKVVKVQAAMQFARNGQAEYDKLCLMHLETERGLVGRVVQDVVTRPPRKWARAQGTDGFVEWWCGYQPGVDAVFRSAGAAPREERLVQKTRPDDFIQELRHIEHAISSGGDSGLSIERGLDTMMAVAAAYKSAREGRTITIDYAAGYTQAALQ